MKLKHFFILVLLALIIFILQLTANAQVRDFANRDYTVWATTIAPTTVGVYQPGRRYYLVTNESLNYNVRHATFPITVAQLGTAMQGLLLTSNGGHWEDGWNVYQSTYWVIISSLGCGGTETPITAPITYRQRY